MLRDWVTEQLGAIARPDDIRFADNLPKTRSGKIMRRLLRAIARNEDITQDLSTLENPAIIEQLRGERSAAAARRAESRRGEEAGREEGRAKKGRAEEESRRRKKAAAKKKAPPRKRRAKKARAEGAKKPAGEKARGAAPQEIAAGVSSPRALDHAQHRDEVAGDAAEHEQVPHGVRVAPRFPDVERHAAGVQQAAGRRSTRAPRRSGSRAAA